MNLDDRIDRLDSPCWPRAHCFSSAPRDRGRDGGLIIAVPEENAPVLELRDRSGKPLFRRPWQKRDCPAFASQRGGFVEPHPESVCGLN